ncbi:MAG: aspartate dehydrogenase [Blautia sp.]|nr:aspartate dehydrogenase [Blautia sp.]
MLGRKKKNRKLDYDPEKKEPAIRCSICTGEQVAGLVDLKTGVFEEIMVLRNEEDQMIFRQMAGKDSIRRFY